MGPRFKDAQVKAVFDGFPASHRKGLLSLRSLIFEEANALADVGELLECLKWGQPSYLTQKPKTGSTLRLGLHKSGGFALYVHCQTTLMSDFVARFPGDFEVHGNRALLFERTPSPSQLKKLRFIIRNALLYHRLKSKT